MKSITMYASRPMPDAVARSQQDLDVKECRENGEAAGACESQVMCSAEVGATVQFSIARSLRWSPHLLIVMRGEQLAFTINIPTFVTDMRKLYFW